MDGSLLEPMGLAALFGAMIITLYEMGAALRPATCPECRHCQANAALAAREQERLNREFARRVGLDDEDDDNRRIG
jgi:hypothetical protein